MYEVLFAKILLFYENYTISFQNYTLLNYMDFILLKWSVALRYVLVNDLGDGSTDHIAATLANLHPILAETGIGQYVNVTRFFVVHILVISNQITSKTLLHSQSGTEAFLRTDVLGGCTELESVRFV